MILATEICKKIGHNTAGIAVNSRVCGGFGRLAVIKA
jgi:hypothetical protein